MAYYTQFVCVWVCVCGEKSYAQQPNDIKHDNLNKKLIPHNINYLND